MFKKLVSVPLLIFILIGEVFACRSGYYYQNEPTQPPKSEENQSSPKEEKKEKPPKQQWIVPENIKDKYKEWLAEHNASQYAEDDYYYFGEGDGSGPKVWRPGSWGPGGWVPGSWGPGGGGPGGGGPGGGGPGGGGPGSGGSGSGGPGGGGPGGGGPGGGGPGGGGPGSGGPGSGGPGGGGPGSGGPGGGGPGGGGPGGGKGGWDGKKHPFGDKFPDAWKGYGLGKGGQRPPPWAIVPNAYGKPNYCFDGPEFGFCGENMTRWGYNSYMDDCFEFFYSGCGGNHNRFLSKKRCESACKSKLETECDKQGVYSDYNYNIQ